MGKNERRHNLDLNVASMMIAITFTIMLALWFSVQVKTKLKMRQHLVQILQLLQQPQGVI